MATDKPLSVKAVTEFKEIYKEEYGILLSDKRATDKAIMLLNFIKNIYRPIPINK